MHTQTAFQKSYFRVQGASKYVNTFKSRNKFFLVKIYEEVMIEEYRQDKKTNSFTTNQKEIETHKILTLAKKYGTAIHTDSI
jgi:hypothetical protein